MQSHLQRSGIGEDASVGYDTKEASQAGITEGIATTRFDLPAEPGREAIMLGKVRTMGVDENIYVGEDHLSARPAPRQLPLVVHQVPQRAVVIQIHPRPD